MTKGSLKKTTVNLGKGSKKVWNFPHFRGGRWGSDPFPHTKKQKIGSQNT